MPFSVFDLPDDPIDLEVWINKQEDEDSRVKKNARAKIIWANPEKKEPTKYSLIYLHGFKASHGEGHPIHKNVAKSLGFNLYLSRLEGHGLDEPEPLKNISSSSYERSALKALAVGEKIGEKTIIMGTSTGGSLALFLAAKPELKAKIAALILYSPLIEFFGSTRYALGYGFSRKVLRLFLGKNYMLTAELGSSKAEQKIWYHTYALQGVLSLGDFIQQIMTKETFSKVNSPVFTGYYYKNNKEQDKVVSVAAIKKMHHQLATQNTSKVLKNFPEAGTHVICSGLVSGSVKKLEIETLKFINNIIGPDKL